MMPDIEMLSVITVHDSWPKREIKRVLWKCARPKGMDWPVPRDDPGNDFFNHLDDHLEMVAGCPIDVDLSTLPELDMYAYTRHADALSAIKMLTQPMPSSDVSGDGAGKAC